MTNNFDDVCCASIPRDALPLLAALRCEPDLRAALTERQVWLRWRAGSERVIQTVMPIHGAELFRVVAGRWHRFGASIPEFDFAGDLEYEPLAHVLFPAPILPTVVPNVAVQPVRLTLVLDERPRATAALICPLPALRAWSDTVPTVRLASLVGASLNGAVIVMGPRLPLVEKTQRFWGREVLVPLGYAPALDLSEAAVRAAAGVSDGELLLWRHDRADAIERALFAPLTRAGLRLAARKAPW